MKKFHALFKIILISIFALLLVMPGCFAASMPAFDAGEGVCLLDPDTGDNYYAQNENERYAPASTTKILTALTAMDYIDTRLDERVTVGEEITQIDADSSVADLVSGDSYTYRELLYGLMLPSGNDAAMAIAVSVARIKDPSLSIDAAVTAFAEMMNEKAISVGAVNSHFVNPHGLENGDHYTTPADMAKIAMVAFSNTTIAEITQTAKYTCISGNGVALEWQNSNVLLHQTIEKEAMAELLGLPEGTKENPYYSVYAKCGKTGHTDAAGRCLVFSGENGESHLVGVIFKASDLMTVNSQAHDVLETAMKDYTHVTVIPEDGIYLKTAVLFSHIPDGFVLKLDAGDKRSITVPKNEADALTVTLKWDESLMEVTEHYIKIKKAFKAGDVVAALEIRGKTYSNSIPLYADRDMAPFGREDQMIAAGAATALLIIILAIIILIVHKNKKKNNISDLGQQL